MVRVAGLTVYVPFPAAGAVIVTTPKADRMSPVTKVVGPPTRFAAIVDTPLMLLKERLPKTESTVGLAPNAPPPDTVTAVFDAFLIQACGSASVKATP